jgi:hypothetical protein
MFDLKDDAVTRQFTLFADRRRKLTCSAEDRKRASDVASRVIVPALINGA